MNLLSRRYIVIDTETTGLPHQPWARVVELAAVLLDEEGAEVDTFSSLVCPEILDHRAEPALAVNHLTLDDLRDAPSTREVAAAWYRWWMDRGQPMATAYNVQFDRHMVERMLVPMAVPTPTWGRCIMEHSTKVHGRKARLGDVALRLGIQPQEPAHRALADARTAALIMVELQRQAWARATHADRGGAS